MKQYTKYAYMAMFCIAIEAILEFLVPLLMANLIDYGVANNDEHYIYVKGLQMIICAVSALILGAGSARFAAVAGQGLGGNLRKAENGKRQAYSFLNINPFRGLFLFSKI